MCFIAAVVAPQTFPKAEAGRPTTFRLVVATRWRTAKSCVPGARATSSRVLKNLFDHPPGSFLARQGGELVSEGHPKPPGTGASPLCTPLFQPSGVSESGETAQVKGGANVTAPAAAVATFDGRLERHQARVGCGTSLPGNVGRLASRTRKPPRKVSTAMLTNPTI